MKIALTYNLRSSDDESEAELDTQANIDALANAIGAIPLCVDQPVGAIVDALANISPDLVFNIAEGRSGKFREAFYPALFEQLGFAYTGSEASTLAVTLDKALTKRIVRAGPKGRVVNELSKLRAAVASLEPPLIVKPNCEGSSKGIAQRSVTTSRDEALAVAIETLANYPDGVLIEEFIDGVDVGVCWLESEGALAPAAYRYQAKPGEWRIYDLALKTTEQDRVVVEQPARLPELTLRSLRERTERIMRSLGVRDVGRVDYRVDDAGRAHFLEVNALPAMIPGVDVELYFGGVDPLASIIESATRRRARDSRDSRSHLRSTC